jgi:hypothetical protein
MSKNLKKLTTTVFLISIMAFASFAFLSPIFALHEVQIHPLLSVFPNPVGVGEQVTVLVFTQPIPPTREERFTGLTVSMERPDGSTHTFGPDVSGPLGNVVWTFVPDAAGTYKFIFHIPDQTGYDDPELIYLGSDSPVVELEVLQEAPEPPVGPADLPNYYWTFPINAENREWAGITGSWLQGSYDHKAQFNPHAFAPKTAHILWTYRHAFGGIEGGEFSSVAFAQGRAYESKDTPGILINNLWYQYGPIGDRVNLPTHPLNAFDIATGEPVWSQVIESAGVSVGSIPLVGQIYRHDSVNQVGLHAYLWSMSGGKWSMFDAFTGEWIMDLENAMGGGVAVRETVTGNIMYYMVDSRNGWMAAFNLTKCFDQGEGRSDGVMQYQSNEIREVNGVYGASFRPRSSAANDWMKGIEWNVSIPIETDDVNGPVNPPSISWGKVDEVGTYMVAESLWNDPILAPRNQKTLYGYWIGDNPRKLWGPVAIETSITTSRAIGEGVYVINNPYNRTYLAFDLDTGEKLWESEQMTFPWGAYADLNPVIAYGRLYASCYDGLWAFDLEDGTVDWHFTSGNAGTETPYGTWVGRSGGVVVADNKCYWTTGVWHPTAVMQRGDKMFCVDAHEGTQIFNITGMYDSALTANGVTIGANMYDNTFYCYGKGPSKTTVEVSPSVVEAGQAALIEVMVTDESAATQNPEAIGKYPNGVPAISDRDMSAFMEFLYMERDMPMNIIGVPVALQAVAPDGNVIDIATTIYTDANGKLQLLWTPPTEGTYKILATLCTTDSFWPSWDEAGLGVVAAHPSGPIEPEEPTTEEPTEPEQPTTEAPLITTEVAIIAAVVVIVVIGIVAYWALRRRQ